MNEGLNDLVRVIDPKRTVLFFGAGASRSSGAPLATELVEWLEAKLAGGEHISDDLAEVASILEYRYSRRAVTDAVVERLVGLEPDGALVALASFHWPSIYTTNYDRLVEMAFERAHEPLAVVRSNYEWENAHLPGTTVLFKIHGCISQDRSRGHSPSMILTVEDYVEYDKYRQLLFQRLGMELSGAASLIIVGYSLRDPHLQALVRDALRVKREAGAPGAIHLLIQELDSDRAALWRQRGLDRVVQGSLNDFAYCLSNARGVDDVDDSVVTGRPPQLSRRLAACTIDVRTAVGTANPKRVFFGGSPSYADIRDGSTFPRDTEARDWTKLPLILVVTGVAGTGKTTLARRLLLSWSTSQRAIFEHRQEFPLDAGHWLRYERSLRDADATAVVLIDNCVPFQRAVNQLVRELPIDSRLSVVLTAETSTWRLRQKDRRLFADSEQIELSVLSSNELHRLLQLVTGRDVFRKLVSESFLLRQQSDQLRILQRKCRADMFVCLKVLFSADTLDDIILREYAELSAPFDTIYRTTAGLEAAGAVAHRQMVLRVTGVAVEVIAAALHVLEGMVEETDQNASLGIYVWHTRHTAIAEIISKYKYSEDSDLKTLLFAAVETANPSCYEEVRTLREMCNSPRGIRALVSPDDRIEMYRTIATLMPSDHVVRHRLVDELLRDHRLAEAEAELTGAIEDVGLDPPLQRYKIRRQLQRAQIDGLRDEDRRAILHDAFKEVEYGIKTFPESKYMYFAAADVAEEWFHLTGERGWIEWAKHELKRAQQRLLDPHIGERVSELWAL